MLTEDQWYEVVGMKASEITGVTVGVCQPNCSFNIEKALMSSRKILDIKTLLVTEGKKTIIIWIQSGDKNQLSDFLAGLTELNVLIGIGATYRHPKDIRRSYVEAQDALKMGGFVKETGIIAFNELDFNHRLSDTLTTLERSIIFSIRSANSESISTLVEKFLNDIKHNNLSPDVMKQECLRLIYLGLEVVKETGVEYTWKKKTIIYHMLNWKN